MGKPLETAWVALKVEWGGDLRKLSGQVNNSTLVDGDTDMAPLLISGGGGVIKGIL